MPLTGAATHPLGGPPGQSSATVLPLTPSQTVGSGADVHEVVVPPLLPLEPPPVPPQGPGQNCSEQLMNALTLLCADG